MYDVVEGWEQLPAGFSHPDVAAIAGDRGGRVYLFCRAEHPVLVPGDHGPIDPTWGAADPCRPGNFCAPHELAIDPNGDLYVAEVTATIGVRPGLVRPDCHTLQKFALAR